MSVLEIVLILLGFALLSPWARPNARVLAVPARARAALVLGFALLVVIFVWTGLPDNMPRWQMAPAWILIAYGMAVTYLPGVFRGRAWRVAGWVLLVPAALLAALVPVPNLPAPGGEYPVGTLTFDWTDSSRAEAYDPGANRRIMVQVWYPAAQAAGKKAPYLSHPEVMIPVLAESQLGLPGWMLNHVKSVETNAWVGTQAADGAFPVLVFSHGWTGMRNQNTYQMEELASRGYVVFAADHAYGAAVTVFDDGKIIYNLPTALPTGAPDDEFDAAARILGTTFVGDIRFILNQAERIQQGEISSPLKGRLDLDHVGILGHSTGGGAAIEACYLDSRCDAGVTMDAWLIPYLREIPARGLAQPFLFLRSEKWVSKRNIPLVQQLDQHLKPEDRAITLKGTNHYSFTDIPLFTPLLSALQAGTLFDKDSPHDLINAYTLAFLNEHLKGIPSGVLQGAPVTPTKGP